MVSGVTVCGAYLCMVCGKLENTKKWLAASMSLPGRHTNMAGAGLSRSPNHQRGVDTRLCDADYPDLYMASSQSHILE